MDRGNLSDTDEKNRVPAMTTGDRLTVIGIGLGVIIAIANGTWSTNQRLGEFERRFAEAAEQRREAAEQRREEHGQIIRRLERLEDLHLFVPRSS